MSVYKPKDSSFYLYDFQLECRRFHGSTKCKSQRAAEAYERQIARPEAKSELDAAKRAASPNAVLTFGEAKDRYWNEVGKHHAEGDSRNNTERALNWLVEHIGKDTPLPRVNTGKVAELVARRRGDGVQPATVNRSVTEPLRKVLRRAADVWDQRTAKIAWKDHLLPEPEERVRELSPDEELRFLEHLRPDYLPVFLFSLASGVRMSGCLGLEWADIDWGNRTIRIKGKGGKNYTIPLSGPMREILWPLRAFHDRHVFTYAAQRARTYKVGGVVDKRERGEVRPITIAGLKTEFRRARESAGLPSTWTDPERGYRWHDNRHTRATRLLRQNGNLKMVQRMLGHRRIETTAKYAHVTMDDLREALDAESVTRGPEKTPETASNGAGILSNLKEITK